MRAIVLREIDKDFSFEEVDEPRSDANDSVVAEILNSALNHRDEWIRTGKYAKIQLPAILGSDACVRYDGKEFLVNPNINWGNSESAQSKDYAILGMPSQGTFAERICVPLSRLRLKPHHLSTAEASALPLAGLTAFRAMFHQGNATANDKILVTGVGGGVASFAFQFALAIGAEVSVTSGHDSKIQWAQSLGASFGVNYQDDDWKKTLRSSVGEFDLVIDGAGGKQLNDLLALVKPGGTVVSYGATLGTPATFNIHHVYWKQIRLVGSTMGSDLDFESMVAFVEQHNVKPVVDSVYHFSEFGAAFSRLRSGEQCGKIVLSIQE